MSRTYKKEKKPRKIQNSLAFLKAQALKGGNNKTVIFETIGGEYKITFPEVNIEIKVPSKTTYEQLKIIFNFSVEKILVDKKVNFYKKIGNINEKLAKLKKI